MVAMSARPLPPWAPGHRAASPGALLSALPVSVAAKSDHERGGLKTHAKTTKTCAASLYP